MLYAEYDTAMKAAGWEEAMAASPSQSNALLSFRKDNRVVTVTLAAASGQGGTTINLQHIVK